MVTPETPEPVRAPETPEPVRAPETPDPIRALLAPYRCQVDPRDPRPPRSQIRAGIGEIRDVLARVLDRGAWQEPPPPGALHPKSWAARIRGICAEPLSPGECAELERLRAELAELDAEVAQAPESELRPLARVLEHIAMSLAECILRRAEAPAREDGARWVERELALARHARAGGEATRRKSRGRRAEIEHRARQLLQEHPGTSRSVICRLVARELRLSPARVKRLLPASGWPALQSGAEP